MEDVICLRLTRVVVDGLLEADDDERLLSGNVRRHLSSLLEALVVADRAATSLHQRSVHLHVLHHQLLEPGEVLHALQ